MIYKFVLISDEVDDFMREISIDSDAKFIEFHQAILDAVHYGKDAMTSFFICNEDWEKEQEITLVEMDTDASTDNYVMDETAISELVQEEDQKLLYVFDYVTDRAFFIQLKEIVPGQDLEQAQCTASIGNPPAQFMQLEAFEAKNAGKVDLGLDEDFYGSDDYDVSELDENSFSDMDFEEDFKDIQ